MKKETKICSKSAEKNCKISITFENAILKREGKSKQTAAGEKTFCRSIESFSSNRILYFRHTPLPSDLFFSTKQGCHMVF